MAVTLCHEKYCDRVMSLDGAPYFTLRYARSMVSLSAAVDFVIHLPIARWMYAWYRQWPDSARIGATSCRHIACRHCATRGPLTNRRHPRAPTISGSGRRDVMVSGQLRFTASWSVSAYEERTPNALDFLNVNSCGQEM